MNMFGIIGKILAAPVRIINIPAKLADRIMDDGTNQSEYQISAPLEAIAEEIEKAIGDEDS